MMACLSIGLLLSCEQSRYVGNLADYPGEKEGLLRSYYEDGNLYEEGQFDQGKWHGFRKIYFPSGQLKIQESYQHDIFHGPYQRYFENGNKKVEGRYEEGIMTGTWTSYYESGPKKDDVMMADNLENGPFVEFHENGKTKAIGNYLNGEFEHGLLQLFDTSGTLVKKMECDKGVCRTVWSIEENK